MIMHQNIQLLSKKVLELNKSPVLPILGMNYGSREKNKDIDLFFIFKGVPVEKNIVYENLDLNQIEQEDFEFRLSNWDIEYTEPILTGDYLFGDKEILEKSREFLMTNKPNEQSLDYLRKRSLETYLQAKTVYSAGKNELFNELINTKETSNSIISKLFGKDNYCFESPSILKSLSVLSYSLSYISAQERYIKREGVTTLNQILSEQNTGVEVELVNLMRYFKTKNKDNQKMKILEVEDYFSRTKNLLSQRSY